MARDLLFDTICDNYIRHAVHQRFFARAICILKPVYKTLGEEIEDVLRVPSI